MSTPNGEPQNPYTSGQSYQGQNQQYQRPSYQQSNYPQSSYQNGSYQQPYQQGYQGYPAQNHLRGMQLAQTSMILGIVSIFVLGIVLGPIAIIKANQAEREFNTPATAGKVTGWIGTILALVYILMFVGLFVLAIFAPDTTSSTTGPTYDF